MILVQNYFVAIFFCILCMICWGSWGNMQKLAAKEWSFELFYWDMTIGLFLTSTVAALTLGQFGSDGPAFIDNIAQANAQSVGYAIAGGIVWNLGTLLLTAAMAVAGMSVGFPLGGGLAWIGGILVNYFSGSFPGNANELFIGLLFVVIAILTCGYAYKKLAAKEHTTPKKGFILSLCAGIVIMFFYNLVVKSFDPQFVSGGSGNLTPYTGVFFFGVGILISTPIFNTFAMRHPVQGTPTTYKQYMGGSSKTHIVGIIGGIIWMAGMVVSMMSAGAANPTISYAMSNAAPVAAMIWGIFIWKEFAAAPKGTNKLLALMFICFIIGLVLITMSNA